ncbi:MAG: pentapeptide repeat-containing protein [SAR324 cluster bacterium]|nr:pentapeptide repeat-containing protein [SAR324 cluster bacterium]
MKNLLFVFLCAWVGLAGYMLPAAAQTSQGGFQPPYPQAGFSEAGPNKKIVINTTVENAISELQKRLQGKSPNDRVEIILNIATQALPAPSLPGNSVIVFNNWNKAGCSFTDRASFNLTTPATLSKLNTWYNWQANQTSVAYRLYQNQNTVHQGIFKRGSCDPYQQTWCQAVDSMNLYLNSGSYTVVAVTGRICQNSGSNGNGFIEVSAFSSPQATAPTQQVSASSSRDVTWDFETGNLNGWEREGNAFETQPTYGDNPAARNRETSQHQGNYWIGGYENRVRPGDPAGRTYGDTAKGTMISPIFTITGDKISFLIGGGCNKNEVGIELLLGDRSVRQATGQCYETMKPYSWDVSEFRGRSARIRIYDYASGGWGHINIDDIQVDSSTQYGAAPPAPGNQTGSSSPTSLQAASPQFLGCFKDQSDRDMKGYYLDTADMTTNKCLDLCKSKGFAYAATQYGGHCFCDNSYGRSGPADNCTMPCKGDSNQICGGSWANSVYAVNSGSQSDSPSQTPQISFSAGKKIPISQIAVFPNERKSDYQILNAIDGDTNTHSWVTESYNRGSNTIATDLGGQQGVSRIRLWKESNGGGGPNIKNLTIQYTMSPSSVPLAQRSWQNVELLSNGFNGKEMMNANSVLQDGRVIGDIHNSSRNGWASLSFKPVFATGIAIQFSTASESDFNHYQLFEFEVYSGQPASPPQSSLIPPSVEISGNWNTSQKKLVIRQSQSRVDGNYMFQENGTIYGSLSGNVLTGVWVEDESGKRCNSAAQDGRFYWGKFELLFQSPDQFSGHWGYCNDSLSGGSWTGTRETSGQQAPVSAAITSVAPPQYLGCFKDQSARTLKGKPWVDSQMTPSKCINYCGEKNYKYAGVENGSECFCGNNEQYGQYGSGKCETACTGDSLQKCGGWWEIGVYAVNSGSQVSAAPAPFQGGQSQQNTDVSFSYVGCFKDQSNRDMKGYYLDTADMTTNKCLDLCRSKGFAYAATQYGGHCFCDNSYGHSGPADNCTMPCKGDSNQICGGSWANSIYAINSGNRAASAPQRTAQQASPQAGFVQKPVPPTPRMQTQASPNPVPGQASPAAAQPIQAAGTAPCNPAAGADLRHCNFVGKNLDGADFSNANVSGISFKKSSLKKAKFEGSQCQGTDFSHSNLEKASFRNAQCEKADFTKSKLGKANFRNADLSGTNFRKANVKKTSFKGARLNNSNVRDNPMNLIDAKF